MPAGHVVDGKFVPDDAESEALTVADVLESLQRLRATVVALAIALVLNVSFTGALLFGWLGPARSGPSMEQLCVLFNQMAFFVGGVPPRPVDGCVDFLDKSIDGGWLPGNTILPGAGRPDQR